MLGWSCPSEIVNTWLRFLPFSKGNEGYLAAPCKPSSSPKETVNQELEATGRRGRENSWMLLIILWLQAVVSDTCSPLTCVLSYWTQPPTGWSVIGIMGKRAHRRHFPRIPWLQLVTVTEVTVRCCRGRWCVTAQVLDTQPFHIRQTLPAVSLVDTV